jgi:ADP-ribose pyrophosphatase
VLHLYLARGLHAGKAHLDEDEFLNVEKHSLEELLEMADRRELPDAKTVIAILKAERLLRSKE